MATVATKPYSSRQVYVGCTASEISTEEELKFLVDTAPQEGGIHMGVAGQQNYDIAVRRGSKEIVIVDINDTTRIVHELTGRALAVSETVDEYVVAILKEFEGNQIQIADSVRSQILSKQMYWMQTGFKKIKELFATGKVSFHHADMTSPEFAKLLGTLGKIDTLYISNVADWLIATPAALAALDHLIQDLFASGQLKVLISADGTLKRVGDGKIDYYPIVQKATDTYVSLQTELRRSFMGDPHVYSGPKSLDK